MDGPMIHGSTIDPWIYERIHSPCDWYHGRSCWVLQIFTTRIIGHAFGYITCLSWPFRSLFHRFAIAVWRGNPVFGCTTIQLSIFHLMISFCTLFCACRTVFTIFCLCVLFTVFYHVHCMVMCFFLVINTVNFINPFCQYVFTKAPSNEAPILYLTHLPGQLTSFSLTWAAVTLLLSMHTSSPLFNS